MSSTTARLGSRGNEPRSRLKTTETPTAKIAVQLRNLRAPNDAPPRGWKILLPALCVWNLWLLTSYELLTIVHGVYPTLREATRHAVGLGAP